MNISKQTAKLQIFEKQVCPVCQHSYKKAIQCCSICAWHFPKKDTADYLLALSKAKQHHHIMSTLTQVVQELKSQNKTLEDMTAHIAQLEQTILDLKDDKHIVQLHHMESPKTASILPLMSTHQVASFDTPEKRANWWQSLETQWQKAFNQGFLNKEQITALPNDEDLQAIFETPSLRFVGPSAMHPNLSFELTNLSGLRYLTRLTTLIVTHSALRDLVGIEQLQQLTTLFVNDNQLATIDALHHLPQLKQVYCQGNAVTSIAVVEQLTELNTLYCNYNPIKNFTGITKKHTEKLQSFYAMPNKIVKPNEVRRIEDLGIFCRKA